MKMSEFLDGLKQLFDAIPVPVRAAILSGVIAVLRIAYANDARPWGRRLLETAICVSTTFGISSGLSSLGIAESASWLVAIAVGHLGADWVREQGKKWAERRLEK
jgi:lambda family phage holin